MTTSVGLRESKKAHTRRELARAVLRLAAHDGLDRVTIDAVCAEVGVSPRTFHNYFADKVEAIIHLINDTISRVIDNADSRGDDESLWQVLEYGICATADSDQTADPAELVALFRLTMTEPTFVSHHSTLEAHESFEQMFVDLCAKHGHDGRGLYARLAVDTSLTIARVALEYWSDLPEPRPAVGPILSEAFRQAAVGMGESVLDS
ncbi:TetR/AcrR family transcriptional regulator [Gordonia soli]|nr:TetR/AcrR family transcriptional regulator [Gordonia soli]